MSDKKLLRKEAKQIRKSLDIQKISAFLVEKLRKTREYGQAKNVLIYYPLDNEINLLALLNDSDKNFYLPKIDGQELLCCPFKEGDKTCLSCFKTCEPLTEPCEKSIIDLVILPALACDKNNYRLGYGGGFYDRFLKDYNGKKAVCLPSELIVETIYPEEHDIPVDLIITC